MNEAITPLCFAQTIAHDPPELASSSPVQVLLPHTESSLMRRDTAAPPASAAATDSHGTPLPLHPTVIGYQAPVPTATSPAESPSAPPSPTPPARPSSSSFPSQQHGKRLSDAPPKAFTPTSMPTTKQCGLLGPAGYFGDTFFRPFAALGRSDDRKTPKRCKVPKLRGIASSPLPPSSAERCPTQASDAHQHTSPISTTTATSRIASREGGKQQPTSRVELSGLGEPAPASDKCSISLSLATAPPSKDRCGPDEASGDPSRECWTTAVGEEAPQEPKGGISHARSDSPPNPDPSQLLVNNDSTCAAPVSPPTRPQQDFLKVESVQLSTPPAAIESQSSVRPRECRESQTSEPAARDESVNILIQDAQRAMAITLDRSAFVDDTYSAVFDRTGIDPLTGYLVHGHKILRIGTRLLGYGIQNNSLVFLHARLLGGGKRIIMDDDDWNRYEEEKEAEEQAAASRPSKRQRIVYMEWLEERNHRLECNALRNHSRINMLQEAIDNQHSEVRRARRTVKRAQESEEKYRQIALANLNEREAVEESKAALEKQVAQLSSQLAAVQQELDDQKRMTSAVRAGDKEARFASSTAGPPSSTASAAPVPLPSFMPYQMVKPNASLPALAPLQMSRDLPALTCRPSDLSFLTPPSSPETPFAPISGMGVISGPVKKLEPATIVDKSDISLPSPVSPTMPSFGPFAADPSVAPASGPDDARDGQAAREQVNSRQFFNVKMSGESVEGTSPTEQEIEPMQRELEEVWLGRPLQNLFAVPSFAEASSSSLAILDVASLVPSPAPPSLLFRLEPTLVSGKQNIYAASKEEEPVVFARQFPGFCGDVQFRIFLDVISRCERFVWTIFTVSKPYLLQLLTCTKMKRWAENPQASGLLLVSHSSAHKAHKIVSEANEQIALHLLSLNIDSREARRPRLLVQQVRSSGVPAFHSKTMTAISKDHATLYVIEGSANPSKQGFAGVTSDEHGAAREPASHETAILFTAPVHSAFAQSHLLDLDAFFAHLALSKRLLVTNSVTTAPIRQVPKVAEAEALLKSKREQAGVAAAEAGAAAATTAAWAGRFEKSATYEFLSPVPASTRSPASLEADRAAGNSSSTGTTGAKTSNRILRLPAVAKTFAEAVAPPSTSVAKWHRKSLEDGESMIVGEIVCGDCARQFRGSLPPAKLNSYSVNHPRDSQGCPSKLQPTRSTFVSDEVLRAQPGLRKAMYDAQIKHGIVEPFTDKLIVQLGLSFYAWLDRNLGSSDEIRDSMSEFLNGVDPAHPQLHGMREMLKKAKNDFTHLLNFLQKMAAPALGKRFESTREGSKVRQRPFYAGFLKTVVRHCYSYGGGSEVAAGGGDDGEAYGESEEERENEDEEAADDDDDGPEYS